MTHVHPTQDDPVVGALSEVVGGPVGAHAGPPSLLRARLAAGSYWRVTPLAVLLLITALTLGLGLVSKSACAADGFDDGRAGQARVCTSTIADSYVSAGFDELVWPWTGDDDARQRHPLLAQPAGSGLWAYASARLTHVLTGSPALDERFETPVDELGRTGDGRHEALDRTIRHERVAFTAINVVGLALLALLATWALASIRRRRPWDAAGFAAAPVLLVAGPVSWDLLAVAAAAGALWAWSRHRPVLAGALVGLGAACGLWVALLLPAAALATWRRRGVGAVLPDLLPSLVTGVATWALANAPAFLTGRESWELYWHQVTERPPTRGSVWAFLDQTAGIGTHATHLAAWTMIGVWCVAVVVFCLAALTPPRISQVAFLLVAGVTLFAVDYSPVQALWLLPLAALARPRWRDLLIWQGGELLLFAMESWRAGGWLEPGTGGDSAFYWLAIAVRIACLSWLIALVVRDLLVPGADTVSSQHTDPLTGQETTTRSKVVVV